MCIRDRSQTFLDFYIDSIAQTGSYLFALISLLLVATCLLYTSYHSFMATNLFNHIDCPKENIHILNGNAETLKAECRHYEQMIEEAGGIDLFIGGIEMCIRDRPSPVWQT